MVYVVKILMYIANVLLALIAVFWGKFAYGEFETSPFCIWFSKCWEAKEKEGEIGWNEFLAIMKYVTLHKFELHKKAESPLTYVNLVDMSPFMEEQAPLMGKRQNVTRRKVSSKTQKTSTRKKKEYSNENALSDSEPKPRKKRQTKVKLESE